MTFHRPAGALALALVVFGLSAGMRADAVRRASPERDALSVQRAQILTGRLELVWGDAPPASGVPYEFSAVLVDDVGVRRTLDKAQAIAAAEDLYGLFGRRVAVSVVPDAAAAKRADGLRGRIDAIVPIDDLQPGRPSGRKVRTTAAGGAEPIAGVTSWVTLMCKFNDIATEQKPLSFFQGQYGSAIGQLDHYWQEVSYGQINLAGSQAYGWVNLPQPRSYYVTKDANNKDKADLGLLFTDCVAAHDATVDFSINGGVQGINMMFNGDLDGYAWGGGRCATLDGVNKCWSTTWNPPWSFNNLAPLSHEMGHAYGLPHANNSDADSDPYDNTWDVMSDAWNNGVPNSTYGTLPKHINIYSRNRLGWVATARKRTATAGSRTGFGTFTIDRASMPGSNNVQMLILNYPDQTTRYYTVEVRKRTGSYENRLAGDAVIIHEVRTNRGEPAWSIDADTPPANRSNNEGSMFKVGETWMSPDLMFRLRVDSATTDGFVVTVAPGRITGGPSPALPRN